MSATKLPGGPTQDEVMAVSLQKLGVREGDLVLDLGCGTGKISRACARTARQVFAVDRRAEAIDVARANGTKEDLDNIEYINDEALAFLEGNRVFDCAFVGGTRDLADILPLLKKNVRRRIVVNAVLIGTLSQTIDAMQLLGMFVEAVHVQVGRSHAVGSGLMFVPINPVYIIVGEGSAC